MPSRASTLKAGGDVGHLAEAVKVLARHHEHGEHAVGPVDEGEAFLGLQGDGVDARPRRAPPRGVGCPSAPSTSPSPIRARAQWARGARSPLQPREPCSGRPG